jgi:hypothetical protein
MTAIKIQITIGGVFLVERAIQKIPVTSIFAKKNKIHPVGSFQLNIFTQVEDSLFAS